MESETKVRASIGLTDYQVSIQAGAHILTGDEPVENGGGDTGASPFQMLLSALGACTVTTLRMYAQRKQLNVGEIIVQLVMNTDKGDTLIRREIRFEKALTEEQHTRMIQIANLCPVHKVLAGKIQIETV
ncbi:MAG TPA: OsmC family protein [Bacteroidia bacterium]|nr:OsmC family protein [Bacteroidia bacterium]